MPEDEPSNEPQGTVYRVNSGNYSVRLDSGETVVCRLRGLLKKDLVFATSGSRPRRVDSAHKRRASDPISVGDRVQVDLSRGLIDQILPRRSALSRLLPLSHEQHVLVANLDEMFVVTSAAEPLPDLWILDRFLVMAEASDIPASIVVNKTDLVSENPGVIDGLMQPYRDAGYQVHFVSARKAIGLEELRKEMWAHITSFAGPSGVGKSSLLNALQPGLTLRVGETGEITHKGKHTTTTAELVPIEHGGWIADTPGLRQVNFWQVDVSDIPHCFPEFRPFLGECRFANCRHHGELGCAILGALAGGLIDMRRYRSYKQMTEEA
jgi:ribosome biogenesis GTPase